MTKQMKRGNKNVLFYFILFLTFFGIVAYILYINFARSYNITVHFIDVGQGDATLISSPYGNMLIDGGDNHMGPTMVQYLSNLGIYFINYVIATHPHADHIGGLIPVLDNFSVGTLIMPNRAHTTLTFERFLEAIEKNDINVIEPIVNNSITIGNISFNIVAPNSYGYSNLNDYSIVILMEYRDVSFLFTGDAERVSEQEILSENHNISANVLQVGHHGSNTSTTQEFLQRVNPQIAVISVGEGNMYGHPHNAVINRLNYHGIYIFRTDIHGNILISTNGRSIRVN